MADISLNDFFSGVRLTQLFQSEAVKRGVPDPLPPELAQPSPNSPVGTQVQWDEITGNRQLAVLTQHGAASRTQDVQGVVRRNATAVGSKEDFTVGQQMLIALKNNIPIMADAARRELVNKVSNFRTRMDNLAKACRASVFALGNIYVDGSGNVLPNSSGAKTTVGFNVQSGNKITKDGSGSTYNIGDWSTITTDIGLALRTLRKANLQTNGYNLTTILYGTNVPSYLAANTLIQNYLERNPKMNAQYLDTNEIPDGFLGFKWRPVYNSYFDDSTGTTRQWFPDKFLGVMPDVSPDWYEYFECGSLVPKGIAAPGSSLDAMLDMVDVVYGPFSYAEMGTNPVALKLITGNYMLPTLKVPGTYYFGTCA